MNTTPPEETPSEISSTDLDTSGRMNGTLMMQMAELYTQFMLKNVCAMCHEEVHPTHHVKFQRRRYCPECYNRKMKINK